MLWILNKMIFKCLNIIVQMYIFMGLTFEMKYLTLTSQSKSFTQLDVSKLGPKKYFGPERDIYCVQRVFLTKLAAVSRDVFLEDSRCRRRPYLQAHSRQ